jgi:type VI protein secretion system component Hcp
MTLRIRPLCIRAFLATLAALGVCQSASAAIYVHIEGLGGDAARERSGLKLEATEFKLAAARPDGAESKPLQSTISLGFDASQSTVPLLEAILRGDDLGPVVVELTEPGERGEEAYLVVEFDPILVSSYSTSSVDSGMRLEQVSFVYEAIEWNWLP